MSLSSPRHCSKTLRLHRAYFDVLEMCCGLLYLNTLNFTHVLQGVFPVTGAIIWLPRWSILDGYGRSPPLQWRPMCVKTPLFTRPLPVRSAVCSGAHQRKHENSASLAFMRGTHWWLVDSLHKGSVKRKIFQFDDVIVVGIVTSWWHNHKNKLQQSAWIFTEYTDTARGTKD